MLDASLVAAKVLHLKPPVSIGDKCANCDRPSLAKGAARLRIVIFTYALQLCTVMLSVDNPLLIIWISMCATRYASKKRYGTGILNKMGSMYFICRHWHLDNRIHQHNYCV